MIPFFSEVPILPLPPGLEVGAKLKPQHEEMTGHHLLFSRFGLQAKVNTQVLETGQPYKN